MGSEQVRDPVTGREFHLDTPDDYTPAEDVVFILNLHGGGSSGIWQRGYFPAHDYRDEFRLVVATPTAKADNPRRWVAEDDDEHLRSIVDLVVERFGREHIRSFWLAGHSQGGMTSNRLLRTGFFADRVDGWLSLSGGRIGPAPRPPGGFGRPRPNRVQGDARADGRPQRPFGGDPEAARRMFGELHEADFSFIYATGEHEIASLPETSPWAERYGAGPRVKLDDVVDEQPGRVRDGRPGMESLGWGREARPGTAQVYVYPDARDDRLIADIVRLDKGHTEGLEPNITRTLVEMMAGAPGGKLQRNPAASRATS